VSLTTPKYPSLQRISSSDLIDVTSVTTEIDTLFETVVDLAQQVDPIKLNHTLTATAQALDGLGKRFGQSIVQGNQILADINPRIPQVVDDTRLLADLADAYAPSEPNLFDGLRDATTTANALSGQQGDLDAALIAAIGFGNTGGDIFDRSATCLHDPQLPRRRTKSRGNSRRKPLFRPHPQRTRRAGQPLRLSGQPAADIRTTCRG
jgi:phospholipid/cholesterol/gamma-HCH transport system substrate-binding protein